MDFQGQSMDEALSFPTKNLIFIKHSFYKRCCQKSQALFVRLGINLALLIQFKISPLLMYTSFCVPNFWAKITLATECTAQKKTYGAKRVYTANFRDQVGQSNEHIKLRKNQPYLVILFIRP